MGYQHTTHILYDDNNPFNNQRYTPEPLVDDDSTLNLIEKNVNKDYDVSRSKTFDSVLSKVKEALLDESLPINNDTQRDIERFCKSQFAFLDYRKLKAGTMVFEINLDLYTEPKLRDIIYKAFMVDFEQYYNKLILDYRNPGFVEAVSKKLGNDMAEYQRLVYTNVSLEVAKTMLFSLFLRIVTHKDTDQDQYRSVTQVLNNLGNDYINTFLPNQYRLSRNKKPELLFSE